MSAPAAKAFSLPVTTIAPMFSSLSNLISASVSSRISSGDSAFKALGRLSVTRPTLPRVSTRMVS